MKKLIALIFLCLILVSCASRQTLAPLDPDDEFERAMSFFENKKYADAAQAFERIIFYHPTSEYVDDAQFWLGKAYFEDKDYIQAIIEFDYLIRNFPRSIFFEEAYFYRAKSYLSQAPSYEKDQTELTAAISHLDDFLTMFPNSQFTEEVKELILKGRDRLAKKDLENGKLYLKLNKLDAALFYFNYVMETYPETKASTEAKYHAAELLYKKKGEAEQALTLYKELARDEEWKEKVEKRIREIEEKYPIDEDVEEG